MGLRSYPLNYFIDEDLLGKSQEDIATYLIGREVYQGDGVNLFHTRPIGKIINIDKKH